MVMPWTDATEYVRPDEQRWLEHLYFTVTRPLQTRFDEYRIRLKRSSMSSPPKINPICSMIL